MDSNASYSDEIDIRQLIAGLLKRKRIILFGVAICTALAMLVAILLPPSYSSTGFYSISIPTPEYKGYTGLYEDASRLNKFIEIYYPDQTWVVTNSIFKDAFEPVYSYGKNPKNLEKENKVIGIKITVGGGTPEIAQTRVEALGKYITTNILNLQLWNNYGPLRSSVEATLIQHKKDVLKLKNDIAFSQQKKTLIEDTLLVFDKSTKIRERPVVQVDDATAKYLPPYQRLVALKVTLNNMQVSRTRLFMDIKMDNLMLGFIDKIEGLFVDKNEFIIDQSLLQKVKDAKREYFASLEVTDYAKKAVSFNLEGQFAKYGVSGNSSYKFISGPSLPISSNGSSMWLIVFGAFVLSTFVLLVYSFFLSWWEQVIA